MSDSASEELQVPARKHSRMHVDELDKTDVADATYVLISRQKTTATTILRVMLEPEHPLTTVLAILKWLQQNFEVKKTASLFIVVAVFTDKYTLCIDIKNS